MNDALMGPDDVTVEVDNVAGQKRIRSQAADHIGVAAARYEADVLAVMLVGDLEAEAARQFARLGLGHIAERKAQILKLLARGRKQEVALVAIAVRGANECT